MGQMIRDWWRRSSTLHELRHLDDRLLADMGLDRMTLNIRVAGDTTRTEGASANLVRCGACTGRGATRPA